MAKKQLLKNLTSLLFVTSIVFLSISIGLMSGVISETTDQALSPVTENNHLTPAIWSYENILGRPDNALLLSLNQKQWEALVAVTVVPAFIGRTDSKPLIFDDGFEELSVAFQHDTQEVTTWGNDPSSASAAVATKYWSRAELVFAVETYEQALWVVPSAAFLNAPILVTPTKGTLDTLGTQCVISTGTSNFLTERNIILSTKESVWSFQLELYATKGIKCNYVVITNPHDTDDNLNPNIKWPYLSLASAPLAAFRNALVQTGDYTGDKEKLEEVTKAQGRLDSVYNQVKPYFEKVKSDSYAIEKYLIDNGHPPEFIAIVGGAFAVPDYYFDIHTDYKYWDQILDYVPSISPYANLTPEFPTNVSVKEDLGAGRIVGHSIFDASMMLMRTFFYSEFLTGGEYSSTVPANWEKNAAVLDGHRLNQPRDGGPPNETYTRPYYPGGEILELQQDEKYSSNYFLPRNESDPYDSNPSVNTILDNLQSISLVQVLAHGGSMRDPRKIWLEGGYPDAGGEEKRLYVTPEDIMTRNLPPSLYYFIACHTAHIFVDIEMNEYFPLAFLHSGAVTFIGPVTCQAICFWYRAPYGPASTQAQYFWENVISKDMPVGTALARAKWAAYQDWVKDYPNDQRIEPDGPAFHIFGDPAHRIYIPDVKYGSDKIIDLDIISSALSPGKQFTVQVVAKDLANGNNLDSAQIKINFQGVEQAGPIAEFTAPTQEGEYKISFSVSYQGYSDLSGETWVQIGESGGDGDDEDNGLNNIIPWIGIIIVIVIILIVIGMILKIKKKKAS